MTPESILSFAAAAVLHAIRCGRFYGFEIMDATGLASGTVYPALRRLEKARFVHAAWEADNLARGQQRPPRKYYRLTRSGETALASAALRYRLPDFAAVDAAR